MLKETVRLAAARPLHWCGAVESNFFQARRNQLGLVLLLGLLAAPGTAAARPTSWDVGFGIGYGAFGVAGDYADEHHVEGGGLMRPTFHFRLGQWEGEGDLTFAYGAAEDPIFDEYGYSSVGLHAKRFFTLLHATASRDSDAHLEAYVRASARKVEVSRVAETAMWGYGYGGGLQLRTHLGHKRARASMALWVDIERIYTGAGLAEQPHDSRFQTITFGLTLFGLGG